MLLISRREENTLRVLETFDFGPDFLGLDLIAGPEVNKQKTNAFRPFFGGWICLVGQK